MQHVIIVLPGQWRLIRDMLKETQSLDVIAEFVLQIFETFKIALRNKKCCIL